MKNKIEELRKAKGLNQDDLAKILRVSRQTIRSIETGEYSPSLELAFAISCFFSTRIEEIFVYERGAKRCEMKDVRKIKKNNFIIGTFFLLFSGACLLAVSLTETRLETFLRVCSFVALNCGVIKLFNFFYWSFPKNEARYEEYLERLDNEIMEMNDELKTKVRDKAGKNTYSLGLLVVFLSILVFYILGTLEVIDNTHMIVFYLSGYLLFQMITVTVIYYRRMKKY